MLFKAKEGKDVIQYSQRMLDSYLETSAAVWVNLDWWYPLLYSV